MKNLICIKEVFGYKVGRLYNYRDDVPDCIYIFYNSEERNIDPRFGNKFHFKEFTNNGPWSYYLYWYGDYFISLKEYRKKKLERLKNL